MHVCESLGSPLFALCFMPSVFDLQWVTIKGDGKERRTEREGNHFLGKPKKQERGKGDQTSALLFNLAPLL